MSVNTKLLYKNTYATTSQVGDNTKTSRLLSKHTLVGMLATVVSVYPKC